MTGENLPCRGRGPRRQPGAGSGVTPGHTPTSRRTGPAAFPPPALPLSRRRPCRFPAAGPLLGTAVTVSLFLAG